MDGRTVVERQREDETPSFEGFGGEMRLLLKSYRFGPPGLLTKLVEMPVRRQSHAHHSRTSGHHTTYCCLGQHRILFSSHNTKDSNIILYNSQKTRSGPLPDPIQYSQELTPTSASCISFYLEETWPIYLKWIKGPCCIQPLLLYVFQPIQARCERYYIRPQLAWRSQFRNLFSVPWNRPPRCVDMI